MSELVLRLMLSWLSGLGLGAFFFGGLWWTLKRGMVSERPAFWFSGSLLLRMSLTVAGFYVVGAHHWQRLIVCLAGFLMSRAAVTRLTRRSLSTRASFTPEVRHGA